MRETTLSICERNFILNAASELKRLDGRKLDEFRNVNVYFGTEWGLCYVSLGETRVITQVSCEVQQPKTTRPNEGLLYLNVEVSSMAAPHIEPGRSSDVNNHLNRLLEKCIKDSKAVDLESLCLVAEEKVWALRVDVSILNHDGNLEQAASMSALAALAHFKRPDVTTNGEEIVIHDISERDPIQLTLHHFPVCITYSLLNNGVNVLADPTSMEERVSDTSLVFGINSYGEICALHMGGNALVEPNLILRYGMRAATKAKEAVNIIKAALENDSIARQSTACSGLVDYIPWDSIKSVSDNRLMIQLSRFKPSAKFKLKDEHSDEGQTGHAPQIIDLGENCAELVPASGKEPPSEIILQEDSETMEDEPSKRVLKEKSAIIQSLTEGSVDEVNYGDGGEMKWEMDINVKKTAVEVCDSDKSEDEARVLEPSSKKIESIDLSGDSEEEVMVLEARDIENPSAVSKNKKGNYKSSSSQVSKSAGSSREFKNKKRKNRKN